MECSTDRPSDAIAFSVANELSLANAPGVALDSGRQLFLIAVPMNVPRSSDDLAKKIGGSYTMTHLGRTMTTNCSELFSRGTTNSEAIASGHDFYCGYSWRCFTWAIAEKAFEPYLQRIDASVLDISRHDDQWLVACVPADHSRTLIESLTSKATRSIDEIPASPSEGSRVKQSFTFSVSQDNTSLLNGIKDVRIHLSIDRKSRLQVLLSDPFQHQHTTLYRQSDKESRFSSIPFNHPFSNSQDSLRDCIYIARPANQTSTFALLSMDQAGTKQSSGPRINGRIPEIQWQINLIDTESGRPAGRDPISSSFLSSELVFGTRQLPTGHEAQTVGLRDRPTELRVSPGSNYASVRVRGSGIRLGIIDLETHDLTRIIESDDTLQFLQDGLHALVGETVVELRTGGTTVPIAKFGAGLESDE